MKKLPAELVSRRRRPRRCRYDGSIVTREGQEQGKFFCYECNRVLNYSETKTR